MDADLIVIGAGVVGAALAYGAARHGRRVLVLDGGDGDMRAARANFGLVWVQGKGADRPAYGALTRQSADLWPQFLAELTEIAQVSVDYSRPGGLMFCLGPSEYEARAAQIGRTQADNVEAGAEMLTRAALQRMLPAVTLGLEVAGASYDKRDGHVNPLHLLAALHRAIGNLGSRIVFRNPVQAIAPDAGGFCVTALDGRFQAACVVVAAGLATPSLTGPVGLSIPLRAERGQLLVTERLRPVLPFPASGLRQTADGTVMIGATHENATDRGVTVASAASLARRATRIIPALASVRLVRQWSGFRILPPDGVPIYAECPVHRGLFAAVCHSGVTLAAAHAAIIAPAMAQGFLPDDLSAFSTERFDVQKCA